MKYILQKEILAPIIIILVSFFLCISIKKILNKVFKIKTLKLNQKRAKTVLNLITNIIIVLIIVVSLLIILEIYGIDTKSLVTSLGVVGIIVGLAIQDILKDFLVGMSIIFEGQYFIGDWVSINGFKGEVLPSNLKTTRLKSYTGEIKIISNRTITELVNYSISNTNMFVDVSVSYNSDIIKVKEVLDNLCAELKSKYKIREVSCLGVQSLESSSIVFRILVGSNYSKQYTLDREIKREIVLALNKNKIEIPYNQLVVHNGKRI